VCRGDAVCHRYPLCTALRGNQVRQIGKTSSLASSRPLPASRTPRTMDKLFVALPFLHVASVVPTTEKPGGRAAGSAEVVHPAPISGPQTLRVLKEWRSFTRGPVLDKLLLYSSIWLCAHKTDRDSRPIFLALSSSNRKIVGTTRLATPTTQFFHAVQSHAYTDTVVALTQLLEPYHHSPQLSTQQPPKASGVDKVNSARLAHVAFFFASRKDVQLERDYKVLGSCLI